MADTLGATGRAATRSAGLLGPVTMVRIAIIAAILLTWEAGAASGLFYRDVVPSVVAVARALVRVLADASFYWHLGVTMLEIGAALAMGGTAGLVIGIALGGSRLLSKAIEPYLYYLGPTPKIIFFPVLIMLFGIGPGSKVAMGAISCFFPIVLSVAAAMRQIPLVLIRVGQSFRAGPWHMALKIYIPAMRHPIINAFRLGLGIALIGTLLAETKMSNRGIGHLIIQAYALFDMPRMYAMLIILFAFAIGANSVLARAGKADGTMG